MPTVAAHNPRVISQISVLIAAIPTKNGSTVLTPSGGISPFSFRWHRSAHCPSHFNHIRVFHICPKLIAQCRNWTPPLLIGLMSISVISSQLYSLGIASSLLHRNFGSIAIMRERQLPFRGLYDGTLMSRQSHSSCLFVRFGNKERFFVSFSSANGISR